MTSRTGIRSLAWGALAALTVGFAAHAAALDTEDVLYMHDGRELHGQILEESETALVFKVVDRELGLSSTITISKSEIMEIERDVALEGESAEAGAESAEGSDAMSAEEAEEEANFDPSVPSLYIIPLQGVMGTDIYWEVYEGIIDDVKAKDPDVVVLKLKSGEERATILGAFTTGPNSVPYFDMEDYIRLVDMLQEDLSEYRQVMWIEDSVGISSLLALAWDEIYMKSDARLAGLVDIFRASAGWDDPDVRAKMIAAWTGMAKGFVERGGHSLDLAEAMMVPDEKLSATFHGRDVEWSNDEDGQYVLDMSEEMTVDFTAEHARNFRISEETADTVQDLAFLLGFREYQTLDSKAERVVENYVENWRETFKNTEGWFKDYQQALGWANGDQTVQYLGRAKQYLQKIVQSMIRYRAVEKEWERRGWTRLRLELMIEELEERIRAIRQGGSRGGGGGGFGGGGGGLRPGGGG